MPFAQAVIGHPLSSFQESVATRRLGEGNRRGADRKRIFVSPRTTHRVIAMYEVRLS